MNWLQQLSEWLGTLRCWYTVRPWEAAISVRCGRYIKELGPGLHLRIPLLDQVFIQNTRQRVLNLPLQTVSSRVGATITLSVVVRWRIANVRLLYERLHTPEDWVFQQGSLRGFRDRFRVGRRPFAGRVGDQNNGSPRP